MTGYVIVIRTDVGIGFLGRRNNVSRTSNEDEKKGETAVYLYVLRNEVNMKLEDQ